uniref:Uncharacterized protein n=1 Tax=Roseihalotalea indica TaxID=2867963 RepID=A0AA49JG45_9BACT|nr:hypothetical protein K4G66_29670 [Tunicatimonas sp. TK19036]
MTTSLNFKSDVLPFLIATVGEFIALHFWFTYMEIGQFVLANILLWIGFGIERGAVALWLKKVYRPKEGITSSQVPVWQQFAGWTFITFTEIVVWVIWWYTVDDLGHLWGAVVLYILMLLEHSAEMGLVKRRSLWIYAGTFKTNLFTLMEVLGAAGWMYFHQQGQHGLAIASLLVGLSVEHVIQGSSLKPKETVSGAPVFG